MGSSALYQVRERVRRLSSVSEATARPNPTLQVCDGAASLADGAAAERWASNCLRRDGVLTAEPLLDVLAEFSGEWLDGAWCGVTQYVAENMRWGATWVRAGGDPGLPPEVRDFVFAQRAVERALAALDVPRSCGVATCGVDCAVARGAAGGLEVRPLELNARTTMSHYAHAARRR